MIKTRQRRLYALLLGCALMLATALAVSATFEGFETAFMNTIYNMSPGLTRFAVVVTQLGSVWVLMFIVALLLVIRRNPMLSLLVLRNGVLAYLCAELLKRIVQRPRPFEIINDVVAREVIVSGYGFPSGHTAMATALGLTLLPYLPKRWRWIVPVWISLVAWSRMYLGVHAPLDVVGGFAIGALIALIPQYALGGLPGQKSSR